VLGLLGGLAVFLLGLDTLTNALRAQTGEGLRTVIGRLTTNRFAGLATGTVATILLQSSTITTVISVGLVSGGMLTFTQSLGVILGANVGTTFTAQIIAFSTSLLGLTMLFVGYLVGKLARRSGLALAGTVLLGLGLVFLGMELMSDAVRPLRGFQPFLDAMESLSGTPLLAMLAGALFTALVQSSSATTGVAIAMASEGLIPLEAGVAIIIGSNIGTCVTALLAAIGKPPAALRTALFHVIVNVGGAVTWFFFIDLLVDLAVALAPSYPELTGLDRRAAETPRQFAMAHTVFNLSTALVLVWFLGPIGRWLERLVPDREPGRLPASPSHLDHALLITAASALEAIREEVVVLAGQVQGMADDSLQAALADTDEVSRQLEEQERSIDARYLAIVAYTRDLLATGPGTQPTRHALSLLEQADELERIADQVCLTILPIGAERREAGVPIPSASRDLLEQVRQGVSRHLANVIAGATGTEGATPHGAAPSDQDLAFGEVTRQARSQLLDTGLDPAGYAVIEDLVGQYARIHDSATRIRRTRLAHAPA
jgi:phosphate:Na+ symporter